MFADENFFSPSATGSDFLSSEPRKSVGAPQGGPLGVSSSRMFGVSDELLGGSEGLSQSYASSQKTPQPSAAAQTPDGCICSTIGMLRRAVKERKGGGGSLRLFGRDVGLVCLCGSSSNVDIRSSLFKFVLQDTTGSIEVECASKPVLNKLQQQTEAPEEDPASSSSSSSNRSSSSSSSTELLCKTLREGGLVSVYGYACTDDKGAVYIDCLKVAAIEDPSEYIISFPLRVIAAAMQAQAANTNNSIKNEDKLSNEQHTNTKQETQDEASMELYEHVSDPLQRQLLKLLLAAENKTMNRQTLPSKLGGHSADAIEEALKALEDSGDIAMTSTWVSLAS
ncbi:hypothetical protein, conserved [Eimeria acervulina]|uniref:Uncharacterized protein n=1 Tax=Eimeria acervulina TaxID=5801 RepID=U6GMD0_EIMAC|nr:hypothetical protein, conserved [Eimeria acervulina]CDI80438.1 hypothetical protein, conserved [Eimeria acervulina]